MLTKCQNGTSKKFKKVLKKPCAVINSRAVAAQFVTSTLNAIPKDDYKIALRDPERRYRLVIEKQGEYIEKLTERNDQSMEIVIVSSSCFVFWGQLQRISKLQKLLESKLQKCSRECLQRNSRQTSQFPKIRELFDGSRILQLSRVSKYQFMSGQFRIRRSVRSGFRRNQ